MKSIRNLLIGMVITGGLAASLHFLNAQETATSIQGATSQNLNSMSDTEVLLQTIESVPPAPASTAPRAGTFWSAQHAPGTHSPWAPLPSDNGLPVWNLGDGVYLLDDLQVNYSALSSMAGGRMSPDGFGLPGGGTNGGSPVFSIPPVYTTNDLWLQMIGVTNTTAYMTIHPPWTVTNGVWDLYYTTNLTAPADWSWVLRSFAGVNNLAVTNATDAQGFYRLGPLNDPVGNDSLGTNFWVAFIDMYYYYPSPPYTIPIPTILSLYISSPAGASGTVTYFKQGGTTNAMYNQPITNTFTVAAGAVVNMIITNSAMIDSGNDDYVADYSIHVTASQPVSVYGMDYAPTVSAAFTGYPTPLLGTNYCLMAYPGINSFNASYASEVAIVATEDNTTVNITPSPLANLEGGNWMYPITLQQGQTYEIASDNLNYTFNDDITGTGITSDKPIAVFAGSQNTLVPDPVEGGIVGDLNPLVQEQLPVETWGTMALSLSFAGRTNGDSYRVLAACSNTVVAITGTVVTVVSNVPDFYDIHPCLVTKTNETVVTNLDAGQFCDFIIEGPVVFQASQAIQVAQFANGEEFDTPNNQYGDPCEILLLPTGHWLETNIVVTLTNDLPNQVIGDFAENYLNLIVAQSAMTNTFVDTVPVATTNFVAIGSSGYYGARLSITNGGVHTVTSSLPVGVEVYGWGAQDAYGYFGGIVK